MARIVNYYEKHARRNFDRAMGYLWSERKRLGEDVRFESGGRSAARSIREIALLYNKELANFLRFER